MPDISLRQTREEGWKDGHCGANLSNSMKNQKFNNHITSSKKSHNSPRPTVSNLLLVIYTPLGRAQGEGRKKAIMGCSHRRGALYFISLEKPGRLEERHEGGGGKKAIKGHATPLEQAVQ